MSVSSSKVIEPELCVSCCCCEVACSFHHTRDFQPSRSSIQVHQDESGKRISLSVLTTCDLCQGEEELLCIRFCPRKGVLSRELIMSLRRS